MANPQEISFSVSDVTGQKTLAIDSIPIEGTVEEFVACVVPEMNLPKNDSEGHPLTYHPLNETAGRHLHATEKIGEAINPDDRIVFQPNVDAGGCRKQTSTRL